MSHAQHKSSAVVNHNAYHSNGNRSRARAQHLFVAAPSLGIAPNRRHNQRIFLLLCGGSHLVRHISPCAQSVSVGDRREKGDKQVTAAAVRTVICRICRATVSLFPFSIHTLCARARTYAPLYLLKKEAGGLRLKYAGSGLLRSFLPELYVDECTGINLKEHAQHAAISHPPGLDLLNHCAMAVSLCGFESEHLHRLSWLQRGQFYLRVSFKSREWCCAYVPLKSGKDFV